MSRMKRVGLVILGVIVVALALIGGLSITRGTPVSSVVTLSDSGPPSVTDSLFERTFELFTGTHVYPGNSVTQALNGDGTYPQLWVDLRSAQHTVTVQMYYSLPGKVADTLAAILKERARPRARIAVARCVRITAPIGRVDSFRSRGRCRSRQVAPAAMVHDP